MKFAIYKTFGRALRKAGAAVSQNGRIYTGFTLIELVVYMAIMGFIIIVAGRVFSDSTKMRVRSQDMIASSEEAGRVSALLKEDISQMGAKNWRDLTGNFKVAEQVYNNSSTDLSSYNHPLTNGNKGIEFKKVHYKTDGTCGAVLKVTWETKQETLYRKCEVINDPNCPNTLGTDKELICPTNELAMATGVTEFKFEPSKPGITSPPTNSNLPFPSGNNVDFGFIVKKSTTTSSTLKASASGKVTLDGFEKNANSNESKHTDFYLSEPNSSTCKQFNFVPNEEYTIDFDLPCESSACRNPNDSEELYNSMTTFQPTTDHLSIGLRNTNMNGNPITGVPDFLFYPPQDMSAKKNRHFEFSVPTATAACIGITAAFYSQQAYSGRLELANIKVAKKTYDVYHFPNPSYNPSSSAKAEVKAFRLTLKIKRKNEISETVAVIPVPNNGVKPTGD